MAENYYLNHTATQIDAILNKVDGVEAGAQVNVQSDWNQTTTTADDYIKNKPTLGSAATKDYTTSVTSGSNDLVTSDAVHTAINEKAWIGTEAAYEALTSDDYDLYFVDEGVVSP